MNFQFAIFFLVGATILSFVASLGANSAFMGAANSTDSALEELSDELSRAEDDESAESVARRVRDDYLKKAKSETMTKVIGGMAIFLLFSWIATGAQLVCIVFFGIGLWKLATSIPQPGFSALEKIRFFPS